MDHWGQHVASWAAKNNKKPSIVKGILIRKGWDPEKYLPSMEKDLNYYLDQWYELSVKKLPTPATARRRNPYYRRNADIDLRDLERKAAESGGVSDIVKYAKALDRVGRNEDAQNIRDILWKPIEFDLSFLSKVKIEATERPPYGVSYFPDRLQTYTLDYPVAGDYISIANFISEWIMAEWGSYEDHEEPEEGHVVNVLQRSNEELLINTAEDLRLLISSIGGCTAGFNYDVDGNYETEITLDDAPGIIVIIKFSEVYGEMSSQLFIRLHKLTQEFDNLTR